jgi:hypothetical protein
MRLDISPTELGGEGWAIFIAEAPATSDVVLDAEHDRFLWASSEEAVTRCRPDHVGASFRLAARDFDDHPPR